MRTLVVPWQYKLQLQAWEMSSPENQTEQKGRLLKSIVCLLVGRQRLALPDIVCIVLSCLILFICLFEVFKFKDARLLRVTSKTIPGEQN